MALIQYPLDSWDTFASVASADAIIGGFPTSTGKGLYLGLDEAGKEAILRQTALQIKLCPSIKLPDTLESDLELGQCYLVVHASVVDMMAYDPSAKAISSSSVGSLSISYDNNFKPKDSSTFDPMTKAILSQYGCKSGGSIMGYAGRS